MYSQITHRPLKRGLFHIFFSRWVDTEILPAFWSSRDFLQEWVLKIWFLCDILDFLGCAPNILKYPFFKYPKIKNCAWGSKYYCVFGKLSFRAFQQWQSGTKYPSNTGASNIIVIMVTAAGSAIDLLVNKYIFISINTKPLMGSKFLLQFCNIDIKGFNLMSSWEKVQVQNPMKYKKLH